MKTKFKKGDRVKRLIDKTKPNGYKTGVVSEVYGRSIGNLNTDILPGIYPEMYEVKWDDGSTVGGYLSTGLEGVT